MMGLLHHYPPDCVGSGRYPESRELLVAAATGGIYCYEILIGERLVSQMKKYKEAMEDVEILLLTTFRFFDGKLLLRG